MFVNSSLYGPVASPPGPCQANGNSDGCPVETHYHQVSCGGQYYGRLPESYLRPEDVDSHKQPDATEINLTHDVVARLRDQVLHGRTRAEQERHLLAEALPFLERTLEPIDDFFSSKKDTCAQFQALQNAYCEEKERLLVRIRAAQGADSHLSGIEYRLAAEEAHFVQKLEAANGRSSADALRMPTLDVEESSIEPALVEYYDKLGEISFTEEAIADHGCAPMEEEAVCGIGRDHEKLRSSEKLVQARESRLHDLEVKLAIARQQAESTKRVCIAQGLLSEYNHGEDATCGSHVRIGSGVQATCQYSYHKQHQGDLGSEMLTTRTNDLVPTTPTELIPQHSRHSQLHTGLEDREINPVNMQDHQQHIDLQPCSRPVSADALWASTIWKFWDAMF